MWELLPLQRLEQPMCRPLSVLKNFSQFADLLFGRWPRALLPHRQLGHRVLQNQERRHCAAKNEKNAARAERRPIPRGMLALCALRLQLKFKHLEQLLWCWLGGFVFVHGFKFLHVQCLTSGKSLCRAVLHVHGASRPWRNGRQSYLRARRSGWSPRRAIGSSRCRPSSAVGLLALHWRYYEWQPPARRRADTRSSALLVLLHLDLAAGMARRLRRVEGFDPAFFGASGAGILTSNSPCVSCGS